MRYKILILVLFVTNGLYSQTVNTDKKNQDEYTQFEVVASKLNIRAKPFYASGIVGSLTKGTILRGKDTFVIEYIDKLKLASWIKIILKNGKKGYVYGSYLEAVGNIENDNSRIPYYYFVLDNNKKKVYDTKKCECINDGVGFNVKLNSYVVAQTWGGEGWAYYCINKQTGSVASLWNTKITFSPGRKRFFIVSVDINASFDPTGFQIFSFLNGRFSAEYAIDCGTVIINRKGFDRDKNFKETIGNANWYPKNVKWKSDYEIIFDAYIQGKNKFVKHPMGIKLGRGRWRLYKR